MAGFIDSPRRWIGAICLGLSLVMVLLGFTVLKGRLQGFDYVFYWLTCIGFTLTAATMALLDFAFVRQKAIHEQRDLIEKTIGQIDFDPPQSAESLPKANNPGEN